MSACEYAPGAVRARDLVAYSDADLDSYLEQHRLDDGVAIDIEVEDPENLPESFIQRLRDRARNTANATRSGAVNLNEVNARLLSAVGDNLSAEERGPSPPYVPGRSPTVVPSPPQRRVREEYYELVREGGRPMYPVELVDHVASDPCSYRHLFRPWSDWADSDGPDWWVIFQTQFWHWEHFRRWQAHSRTEGPPSYVELTYPSRWGYVDNAYNVFVRHFRRGSPSYSDAASRLLAQHNFTRPVQFHQDPTQQDKLTEWIEYLVFECAAHCRYTRLFQSLQPHHDEAWESITNTGLLRPYETLEHLCDITNAHQEQNEIDEAGRAVRLAESALKAAQRGPNSLRGSTSKRPLTVSVATSRLDEAKNALQLLQERSKLITDFIRATSDFRSRKRDIKRQELLIQWILSEMPLVEAELPKSDVSETDPGPEAVLDTHAAGHDTERASVAPKGARKRGRDDTPNGESPSKRARTGGDQMDASQAQSSEVPSLGPQSRLRRRRHTSTSDLQPPNANPPMPLRRSARIATRQQAQNQPQSQPEAILSPVRRTTKASAPSQTHGSPSSRASGQMAKANKPNIKSKRRRR